MGLTSALVALLVLAAVLAPWREGTTHAAVPRPVPAQVAIGPVASAITVPRSFLGASTEYWVLRRSAGSLARFEHALSMLRISGGGPLMVRIGGDSADISMWDPGVEAAPWLFALTPRWLRNAGTLVRELGARLILDLNLAIDSPKAAVAWARAAEAGLPARSIVGFEIGNEPDVPTGRELLGAIAPTGLDSTNPPPGLTPRDYVRWFRSYARALAEVAPRVPLLGPVVTSPPLHTDWIWALIHGARHHLRAVSAHAYPLSACARPGSSNYPTIGRLLGESTSAGVARELSPGVRMAAAAGLPFRLTELNSVTCGGLRGVSDSFATALWAPDTLFELLRAGVASVDIHIRAATINAPFIVRGNHLVARPLLYGLALFARTLGPGARLVPLRLNAPTSLHLKVWAARLADGRLHLLILNKGERSALVYLRIPAAGRATVQRLLAPSPSSRSGVTLAGQQIDSRGLWSGRPRVQTLTPDANGYQMFVPPISAALLSVHLAPPANTSPQPAHRVTFANAAMIKAEDHDRHSRVTPPLEKQQRTGPTVTLRQPSGTSSSSANATARSRLASSPR